MDFKNIQEDPNLGKQVLKMLTAMEKKSFVLKIQTQKPDKESALWKELKKHSPEFVSESLDRKLIYSKLFPSKEFNYGVMKNLILVTYIVYLPIALIMTIVVAKTFFRNSKIWRPCWF